MFISFELNKKSEKNDLFRLQIILNCSIPHKKRSDPVLLP